jgi:hypothetical protein
VRLWNFLCALINTTNKSLGVIGLKSAELVFHGSFPVGIAKRGSHGRGNVWNRGYGRGSGCSGSKCISQIWFVYASTRSREHRMLLRLVWRHRRSRSGRRGHRQGMDVVLGARVRQTRHRRGRRWVRGRCRWGRPRACSGHASRHGIWDDE